MFKRMDLAWITVADYQKARDFFVKTLGMKVLNETPEYGWGEFGAHEGGASLGVAQVNPQHSSEKPGSNAIMTFTVDDIVAKKRELESKGVKFEGHIIEVPGHVKMATFIDKDGNKFQIVEDLSAKQQ